MRSKPTYPRYWLNPRNAKHVIVELMPNRYLDLRPEVDDLPGFPEPGWIELAPIKDGSNDG